MLVLAHLGGTQLCCWTTAVPKTFTGPFSFPLQDDRTAEKRFNVVSRRWQAGIYRAPDKNLLKGGWDWDGTWTGTGGA